MEERRDKNGPSVEITPEMADAGAEIVEELREFYPARDLAIRVYQAMVAAGLGKAVPFRPRQDP